MTTTISIKFILRPETLEGGYIRYTSAELPGFRILCQPEENPIPLFEEALPLFMPPLLSAALNKKIHLKSLRISPSPETLFHRRPAPVEGEAEYA